MNRTIGLLAALGLSLLLLLAVAASVLWAGDPPAPPVARAEPEAAAPIQAQQGPGAEALRARARAAKAAPRRAVGAPRAQAARARAPRERKAPGEAPDRREAVLRGKVSQVSSAYEKSASSFDLSETQQARVTELVQAMDADAQATLADLQAGRMSADEARDELQRQRDQLEEDLSAELGAGLAAELAQGADELVASQGPARGIPRRTVRARPGGGRASGG